MQHIPVVAMYCVSACIILVSLSVPASLHVVIFNDGPAQYDRDATDVFRPHLSQVSRNAWNSFSWVTTLVYNYRPLFNITVK